MASAGERLRRVVGTIAGNRALSRLLLAYSAMVVVEFGQWLALIVYAYARGGATAAGLIVVLQLVPSMLLAPLISARLARVGVARTVAGAYAASTVALALSAAAILAGAPVALVYLTAIAFSLAVGVSRPLHHVLMPLVVRHPDELTSANVATSWGEGAGTLAGPALAGLLITVGGSGTACAALAGLCLCAPILAHVKPLRADAVDPDEVAVGGLAELGAAARVLLSRPSARALIAFPAGAAALEGAVDVLVVVLAVRILAVGPGAAGYLSAAFGGGGLLGAAAAVALVGRRLAVPLISAALVCGLAFASLALASTVPTAVALLVLVGAARIIQSVAAQTLFQRSTPLDVIVCAFALIESVRDLGMILGAVLVPLLIGLGGPRAAFVGVACCVLVALPLAARRVRRIDDEASIPVVEMGVLRNLHIFASLPAASLETLAREASYASVDPGTAIIREGAEGDDYYAITHGSVSVTRGDRELRHLGAGEGFGEIALLRAVRRTATVTATSKTTLLRIGRDAFLGAMRAHATTAASAERIAARRITDLPEVQ
jgi:Cyclic nucleotide-binding domain